ncbi:hypothetical protein SAMN05444161_8534 [Rhizobiales bacterium GAS191]|nr:hypothetical protein SAMN05444161_8534 [Rhizobiales bacterium GAS191]
MGDINYWHWHRNQAEQARYYADKQQRDVEQSDQFHCMVLLNTIYPSDARGSPVAYSLKRTLLVTAGCVGVAALGVKIVAIVLAVAGARWV